MKSVPDRKRLRRKYLWKKARVYTGPLAATAFTALCFIRVVMDRGYVQEHLYLTVVQTIGGLVAIYFFCYRVAKAEVAKIPPVPPVAPSILPAEEVLVRSASEPPETSETLLRATVKGEEVKAEEMLRSSQGR